MTPKETLTFSQISECLGKTRTTILRRAEKENWPFELQSVNGGLQKVFPLKSLPLEIQIAHQTAVKKKLDLDGQCRALAESSQPVQLPQEQLDAAFSNFWRGCTQSVRDVAAQRLNVVRYIKRHKHKGMAQAIASARIEYPEISFSDSTAYEWLSRIEKVPSHYWVAFLTDQKKGPKARTAELTPDAWKFIKSAYLSPSEPTASHVYDQAKRTPGWVIPSLRTVQRMLAEDISTQTKLYWREGPDALAEMYPPMQRTVDDLHAYELVNIDGHLLDVMMRWDDGAISRPLLLGIQDIYSRMGLAWRLCKSENKAEVLAIFGQCFRQWGIPGHIYMDNGRAFASKWIMGQGKPSFRGKAVVGDPLGVLPQLGIEQTFVMPHHGQSKPIERMWGTFATRISKAPECFGAYLGNSPENAPHNRGDRVVSEQVLRAVIAREFDAYNEKTGRRGGVADGRSYGEVFRGSYSQSVIRKATQEQLAICMLAVERVRADQRSGQISLFGNRYWHEALASRLSDDLVVRFDPDAIQDAVYVYEPTTGLLICKAECTTKAGFNDIESARANAKAKGEYLKAQKALAKAERELAATDVAEHLNQTEKTVAPATNPAVVQLARPAIKTQAPPVVTDRQGNVITIDSVLQKIEQQRRAERV